MSLRALMVALLAVPWLTAGDPAPPSDPNHLLTRAPVVFKDQTLFTINTRVGSFTPETRARAISERLERMVSDPFRPIPSVQLAPQEHATDVVCGDTILLTLTDEDARSEGMGRAQLATQRQALLQQVLQSQSWVTRLKGLARSSFWTLVVTALGYLAYRGLKHLFRRLREHLLAAPEAHFPSVRIQKLELIAPHRLRQFTSKALGLLEALLLLIGGYLYISLVFSLFPTTQGLAGRLLHLVSGPLLCMSEAVLDYLPDLLVLVMIAILTRYLLKLVHLIFKGLSSGSLALPTFRPEWAEPTYRLGRILVVALALVVAFPYLPGSGSEAFKGVSLFMGLLLSLGSTGIVGNVVAGIMITYMRPFKLGDRISVGDTIGDVVEKSLLVTRLRTIKNIDVTIPNSILLGTQVQNFSANAANRGLILHSTVTIGYDAPWRTVHSLLIEAAKATPGVLSEPAPFVLQTSLDDFYVSYQINAYTQDASGMATIHSDLHANIQEKFNEAGVEIMSPHYRAARDGNQTTIPADHLPQGYASPAFRIEQVHLGRTEKGSQPSEG